MQLYTRANQKNKGIIMGGNCMAEVKKKIAGWVEEWLGISVRHIFLTPVKETLPYIKKDKCIVIAGTDDQYLESVVLNEHCKEENVQLVQIRGVGHSLEYQGNVSKQ